MYEIIIGRDDDDRQKFGTEATFLLGRHYVKMGQTTSLSQPIFMDVARSHVTFIVGKRGSGKSYTGGAMAEGMMSVPGVSENIGVVIFDTMGVYWTMKYENKKDEKLIREWELEPKEFNIMLYTPVGFFNEYKEKGIPTDAPFSIRPSELTPGDWCLVFNVEETEPIGVALTRAVNRLKARTDDFSVKDIISEIGRDQRTEDKIRAAAENLFINADSWGLFGEESVRIKDLVAGGQITVIDISPYATQTGNNIRALVIGLICQKLFNERMTARKSEEYASVREHISLFEEEPEEAHMPLVWVVVDEAHEFLPRTGKTSASNALITLLREGRQPGISLILMSQQPGKIHTDVITQADIVIAHNLTAKIDIDALGALMQTYMRQSLDKELAQLPDVKGAALIFDDTNERIYPAQIRPKLTWHGGESPTPFKAKRKELFEV